MTRFVLVLLAGSAAALAAGCGGELGPATGTGALEAANYRRLARAAGARIRSAPVYFPPAITAAEF
jgi:hypothetical protein